MTTDLVKVPEDYNFLLNYEFLTRSDREIMHTVDGNRIFKLIRVADATVLTRISPRKRALQVTYLLGVPSKEVRSHIKAYIREWFDLETDLTPFYELAATDRLLRDAVEKYKGYRIVGMPDLFESLCWAVIGQQINLGFAYTLKQRFIENFGTFIEHENRRHYLFPAPEIVQTLTDEDLIPLQFSRQKSKYVRLIAEAFCNGSISKDYIASLSFFEARQKLMSIKGVGNWTANYALMKTFRYKEAFPLEDAGVHNAIKKLRKMKEKPTIEQVKRIFKKYKGWEAYATLYLWKTL